MSSMHQAECHVYISASYPLDFVESWVEVLFVCRLLGAVVLLVHAAPLVARVL